MATLLQYPEVGSESICGVLSPVSSYASVPDNCQLCDLLWSGDMLEEKTYTDMFDWLVRKADCVYPSASWSTEQYLHVWRQKIQ